MPTRVELEGEAASQRLDQILAMKSLWVDKVFLVEVTPDGGAAQPAVAVTFGEHGGTGEASHVTVMTLFQVEELVAALRATIDSQATIFDGEE